MTQPNPDEPEWITWSGGECPLETYTPVEVRRRNGSMHKGRAYGFYWRHANFAPKHDIIAYRVVTP